MIKRLCSKLTKELPNNLSPEDLALFQDRYLCAVASGADLTMDFWGAFAVFYANNANNSALIRVNRQFILAVGELCNATGLAMDRIN